MKIKHTNTKASKRGVALVASLVAAFVAATMISVMMTISMASNSKADTSRKTTTARFLAEGGVEDAKKLLQTEIANWRDVPEEGSVDLNGETVNYTIEETGLDTVATDGAGIQTLITGYEITSTGRSEGGTAQVRSVVNARATPIFQFAVFYTDDLEIFPGANMTLGGRVHSNSDMYLGCGNTMTVNSNYLRAVGKMYRHRKDNPSVSEGTVRVRRWVENPFNPFEPVEYETLFSKSQMNNQGVVTTSGYDANFTDGVDLNGDGDFLDPDEWLPWGPGALDTWSPPSDYTWGSGNTVQDQSHGVGEAVTPHIGSIAMYEESEGGSYAFDEDQEIYVDVGAGNGTHAPGYFHANAGLSIITYDDGSWDAFDESGVSVKGDLDGAVTQTDIYDARQDDGDGESTPVTEIDVDLLNSSSAFPSNGLVYTAHYGMGTGTDAKGVLLKNGAELAGKLSVVSEGSLYIQGDYNTVNKKGASVIGDAVNLLSNNWDGSKSEGNLPNATDTTFNVAIVTGNMETEVGDYNGGLENLPRFHESWSGDDCNIVGSFVNTWQSQYATGEWSYGGDRYQAPRRNWSYDTAFNLVANLPPFTPMAVSAEDVVTW